MNQSCLQVWEKDLEPFPRSAGGNIFDRCATFEGWEGGEFGEDDEVVRSLNMLEASECFSAVFHWLNIEMAVGQNPGT